MHSRCIYCNKTRDLGSGLTNFPLVLISKHFLFGIKHTKHLFRNSQLENVFLEKKLSSGIYYQERVAFLQRAHPQGFCTYDCLLQSINPTLQINFFTNDNMMKKFKWELNLDL